MAKQDPLRKQYLSRIGTAIREARLARGLSQTQVIEMLGINQHTYRDYEHGRREPAAEVKELLAEAIGVDRKLLGLVGDVCPHCGRP